MTGPPPPDPRDPRDPPDSPLPEDATREMPVTPGAPEAPEAPEADAGTGEATVSGRQTSLVAIGALIAIVGLGVIAWLVFLSGLIGGDTDPSPTPTASASASASASAAPSEEPSVEATPEPTPAPTPSPSQQAGPFEVAWTAATGTDSTATVNSVAFLDGQLVAVGSVSEDVVRAAIWTSPDGATWTRAEVATTQGDDEAMSAVDVAEVDGTLVAAGTWGVVPSDQRAWVTWTSTDDGATWTESREGPTAGALAAVASGGPGLVAVGWSYGGTTPFDSYVATSADGVTWAITGQFERAQLLDVGVIGDRIVAVGHVWMDVTSSDTAPAAWYSDDDGATWTAVELPDGGASIANLAPFGDGLAAIGGVGSVSAWITPDGEAWERFDVASDASSVALGAVDAGLVSVGNSVGQDLGPGAWWTSPDAETWADGGGTLGTGSVRLWTVAGDGDVVVAGGQCQASACDEVIWIGEVTR